MPLSVQTLELDGWSVHPEEGLLRRQGETRRFRPQQMDLLLFLAENRERVVSKEEIFEAVWGGAAVEEGALARCISELRKELGDSARKPRFILTVPKRGYRLIAAVAPVAPAAPAAALPDPRRPRSRFPTIAAAVVFLAVAGLGVATVRLLRPSSSTPEPAAADDRARLAVLGFSNVSERPEAAWVSVALEEMLATELASSDGLRLIAGETVARARQELGFGVGETLAPQTLDHLRTHLGADLVVVGTYLVLEGDAAPTVRIDARIQDTASGEVIGALAETSGLDRLPDAVASVGLRLRSTLGLASPATPPLATASALPQDPEALRSYFEGLWRLRRFEAAAAKDLLEQSIAREPQQPLAHLALSQAWSALGYQHKALEAADRAVELADPLAREQRLWVEANRLALQHHWDEAIERFRALWVFSPSNSDYGLTLTGILLDAARPQEALEALAQIRERSADGPVDPRVDLLAGRAEELLGNLETALEVATTALDRGTALDAGLVVAHSLHLRGRILETLGRWPEAEAVLERSAATFAAAGDHRSEAQVHTSLASWYADRGEFDAARQHGETALAVFRQVGDRAGEATALRRLALLAGHRLGSPDEPFAEEALATYREVGDRVGEARLLEEIAISKAIARDYRKAEAGFRQALAIYRQIGRKVGIASVLSNLGRLSLVRMNVTAGAIQLREAEALSEELGLEEVGATIRFNLGYVELLRARPAAAAEALAGSAALFRKLGNRRMVAASLNGQGGALMLSGDLDAARACIESGLEIRLAMGQEAGGAGQREAESQVALARLLVAQGDLAAAELRAREAVASAPMILTWTALGEVLLEQGRVGEALALVEQAEKTLAEQPFFSDTTLRVSILGARLRAAMGDPATARRTLERVQAEAERYEAPLLSMEVRLALAEVELRSGDRTAGETRLAALAAEARSAGVGLLADRARTLPARVPSGRSQAVLRGPRQDPR